MEPKRKNRLCLRRTYSLVIPQSSSGCKAVPRKPPPSPGRFAFPSSSTTVANCPRSPSTVPLHCLPTPQLHTYFNEGANTNKSLHLPPPHFSPASTSAPAFLESHLPTFRHSDASSPYHHSIVRSVGLPLPTGPFPSSVGHIHLNSHL